MAIALRRMLMRLMGFGVVVVLVLTVSSSSTANEKEDGISDSNGKASWIINPPVRPIRPGLGLPPGGMLLMTMDPNATMPDAAMEANATQEPSSQAPVTEVSVTSEEPTIETEAPSQQQSEPEETSASNDEVETETPVSEEPASNTQEVSSQPLGDEEVNITSEPDETSAVTEEVVSLDQSTEPPQQDSPVESTEPEAELVGEDVEEQILQEIITTEQPEVPQPDEVLSSDAADEPVVAALAQGESGVTTLVPETIPIANDESSDEVSHDSAESVESETETSRPSEPQVQQSVSQKPVITTESDIVEVEIGSGLFADSTLIQVDLPTDDNINELDLGSGMDPVADAGLGSGSGDVHVSFDEGSGSGHDVGELGSGAEEGSGADGTENVLVAEEIPLADSHDTVEVVDVTHSDAEVLLGTGDSSDAAEQNANLIESAETAEAGTAVSEDEKVEQSSEPTPTETVDFQADEASTVEPSAAQDGDQHFDEDVFTTEQSLTSEDVPATEAAQSDLNTEEPIAHTTEAEPQSTLANDLTPSSRLRRDVQAEHQPNVEPNDVKPMEQVRSPKEANILPEDSDNLLETESLEDDDEARQYHRRPYPVRSYIHRRPFNPQRNGPVYNNYGVLSRTADYCYTLWCKFKSSLRRLL